MILNKIKEHMLSECEFVGKGLQFAILVTRALQAVVRMRAEDQLQHGLSHADDVRVVRRDLHAGGDVRAAGAEQFGRAGLAHHADAAGRPGPEVRVVAERGDFDVNLLRCIQDRGSDRNFDRDAVDFEFNHVGHSEKTFRITHARRR